MHLDQDRLRVALSAEIIRRFGTPVSDADYQYCPSVPTPKQSEFFALTCREALFGGAAGGGKSEGLLALPLKYVHEPDFACLILRRTFADLSLPGALMDRAHDWLDDSPARWRGDLKRWDFPSGAKIQFGYLEAEKDKYRYKSSEFHLIIFDELTEFLESQYRYMISRNRRKAGCKIPLMVRSASNPGSIGHDWVGKRFGILSGDDTASRRAFVPSLLDDNPHIDQEGYRESLRELDSVTRDQLLHGLWVRDEGGRVYKYDDKLNGCSLLDLPPETSHTRYVLGVDLGAAANSKSTSFVTVRYDNDRPDEVYVVQAYALARLAPSTIAKEIRRLEIERGGFVRIICDDGALGAGYVRDFRERWALPVEAARKQDKVGYIKIMNGDFEQGRLKVVRETNPDLLEEWQSIEWDDKGLRPAEGPPNHLSDATLYAWREAKHWLAEAPVVARKEGEPGWAEEEEARMIKAEEAEVDNEWFAQGAF